MLRYAFLGLLRERADCGYRLRRRFEAMMGPAWRLNAGQVYQTLRVLERAGLVRPVGEVALGPHPRRAFAITPQGMRVLDRWLQQPAPRVRPVRDGMLVRLALLLDGRAAEVAGRLAAQERSYALHLTRLRLLRGRTTSVVHRLGLDAEILHTDAHLRWLASCRHALAGGTESACA